MDFMTLSSAPMTCGISGCPRFAKRNGVCLGHFATMSSPVKGVPSVASSSTSSSPVTNNSSSKMHIDHLISTKQAPARRTASSKDKGCAIADCNKLARIDGFCTKHNMQFSSQKRKCSMADCSAYARTRGLCTRHGGGKTCAIRGCKTVSQTGGMCRAHGGGPRCKFVTCMHFTRVGGLCSQHMTTMAE
ncbi:Aste57867_23516 [Aphanomyces stellatus]|uniref:Aste57867_23516 protein n=1 Tax=Aphanomyces stellatus TaxID=120398 RepID=A0A485LMV0_9STRA|nr:hypothetical protein As57867_023445 [Aphanomyces stellatus]VFU00161.1 Aste57867_23516 [Aphanomyces stellatus]